LQNRTSHHVSAPVAAPLSAQVGFAAETFNLGTLHVSYRGFARMIADQYLAANEGETSESNVCI
jgi:hypothetical protein